jgi:hypothetical protein
LKKWALTSCNAGKYTPGPRPLSRVRIWVSSL